MRALVQRVLSGRVEIDKTIVGACKAGYVVFLGVGSKDTQKDAEKLLHKVLNLRICADENGLANLSLTDTGGDLLIVSQFTLYADVSRGRRPSYTASAHPQQAKELYDFFCECAKEHLGDDRVASGIFGADMRVFIEADGPFTIFIDTGTLGRKNS